MVIDRCRHTADVAPHPLCSHAYARALEDTDMHVLAVPEWGTHVLVRELDDGLRQATGIRPLAALDPACDLQGGLDALRREEIASISLITDPMWCPETSELRDAFTICRSFKETYLIDREVGPPRPGKRHRNNINRARRSVEVRPVSLAENRDRWISLYQENVDRRRIGQPLGPTFVDLLARVDSLEVIAALLDDEIVTMTLWLRHRDVLYYLDGASNDAGLATAGSYGAFAHAIEKAADFRYVMFGGSAGFVDSRTDGLAIFKRGFSNATAPSYLCSTNLRARP